MSEESSGMRATLVQLNILFFWQSIYTSYSKILKNVSWKKALWDDGAILCPDYHGSDTNLIF